MSNEIKINADKVTFSPFALKDFNELFDHIIEFDSEAARKFLREIFKRINLIGDNPVIGIQKDELMVGLRQFPYKNYFIFYFQTESGVEIYRVLHSSRDIVQIFDDSIDEIT